MCTYIYIHDRLPDRLMFFRGRQHDDSSKLSARIFPPEARSFCAKYKIRGIKALEETRQIKHLFAGSSSPFSSLSPQYFSLFVKLALIRLIVKKKKIRVNYKRAIV